MRFKRHIEFEHALKQIDVVPLIDIVLLLVLFFVLTSSFVAQPGTKVNLPKVLTAEAVKYENIEIVVSQGNITYLDGREITTPGLKSLLNEVSKRKQGVLIKSDRRAALGKVVEIWDLCRDSGITQINIATSRE